MTSAAIAVDPLICTIGHSTLALPEFIHLLQINGVTHVLDVRSVPRSRHNPQFNRDSLPAALHAAGIGYTHLAGLGGLRHARSDSINTGWRNPSFRGYADYMQTADFEQYLQQAILLAQQQRCALMCAEALPWRCHRSLIADALLARGIAVEDIIGPHGRTPHRLPPFAKLRGGRIRYPAAPATAHG